jgi:hypothetical protein
MKTDLASDLAAITPSTAPSPVPGYEYVRGFGVFALPFDSHHVLALRVFPQNDFAPYCTVWHRTPDGAWSIFVDGPRIDTACPRYYGAAAQECRHARIALRWTGPMRLSVRMEQPALSWDMTMTETPLVTVMNAISGRVPERLWRAPAMLQMFEWAGSRLFDLGDITLSGRVPNGHHGILMPRRMFPIESSSARLAGVDLGRGVRAAVNPSIGELRLPARPTFAVGGAYFGIQDEDEYQRTVNALRSAQALTSGSA